MKHKIVKRINSYSGFHNTTYHIYKKTWFGWTKSSHSSNSYRTYEDTESEIIKWYSRGLGGIIEVDGNVYTLYTFNLQISQK